MSGTEFTTMAGASISVTPGGAGRNRRSPAPQPRKAGLFVALAILASLLLMPGAVKAAPVRGEIGVSTSAGYARLMFRFSGEPDAQVHLAQGILIINFKMPVELPIDRIAASAPAYVTAVRLDPDGRALRLALARKVTVNSMVAAEMLFVDLLPDDWSGLPPGLPQQVVDELAQRARDAEKRARQQLLNERRRDSPPIRVRVGTQPTFTRYVLELPERVAVGSGLVGDKLTLRFDAPWKFDLGDALAVLPPAVGGIDARLDADTAILEFRLIGNPDTRTFREDDNFVVDIQPRNASAAVLERLVEASKAVDPSPIPPSLRDKPKATATAAVEAGVGTPQGRSPAAAPAPVPVALPVPLPVPRPVSFAPPPATVEQAVVPVSSPPAVEEQGVAPSPLPQDADPARTDEAPSADRALAAPTSRAEFPADRTAPDAITEDPRPAVPLPAESAATDRPADMRPSATPADPHAPVVVKFRQQRGTLYLEFPFAADTAAAVFSRADTLWLVFDSAPPIDVSTLVAQPIAMVRSAVVTPAGAGQVVRIKLDHPKLTTLEANGSTWTVAIGDLVLTPTAPLMLGRTMVGPGRTGAVIPFAAAGKVFTLTDPEIGDRLLVVTAPGPARGFVKPQDFVEFRVLASTHGVAIRPLADDVQAETQRDKVVITRPAGLIISAGTGLAGRSAEDGQSYRPFEPQIWGFEAGSVFRERERDLIRGAAEAPDMNHTAAELDLARFYLAQQMVAEAKAVLDVVLSRPHSRSENAAAHIMRAVAQILLGHYDASLEDLADPAVGDDYDAPLWRSVALAGQGRWSSAQEGFKTLATAEVALPIELQRLALMAAVNTSLATRDLSKVGGLMHDLDALGVRPEDKVATILLKGRVAEALGHTGDALALYRQAAAADGPSAAQAQLRKIVLEHTLGITKAGDMMTALEHLALDWRGDDTEVETLQRLAGLYAEDGRYREALQGMRTALQYHPQSPLARQIQDEAATTFETLFLEGKAEAMSPIDALSLFYDFRALTPAGARGDEMVRRLSDRLVSVDLLDQAAELLQHQVDHRLRGAARAQVAVRLASVYLMARKPDAALQALRDTRSPDLPNELRNQRLLLEARALSDTGQHDLALEVIANLQGKDVDRLRTDILWTARRWREAGEQIEREYGERWRDFAPLSDIERVDVLRGAIAYSLGEDSIGLDRFRQKYAPKMVDGPDRRAFEVVSVPLGSAGAEFGNVAKQVADSATLSAFLHELETRYPGAAAPPPQVSGPAGPHTPVPPGTQGSAPDHAS